MTYTKRKKEETEAGDGRFCATTPLFEMNLRTGWGVVTKKIKGETYLFFKSRRAKCGYGLSFDDPTLHSEPQEGVGWA